MLHFLFPSRRAAFALAGLLLALSAPALAQDAAPLARAGVPSFYEAIDTTVSTWSRYFQNHFPLWLLVCGVLIMAYVLGWIVCQAGFWSGAFGPRAAAWGAITSGFVLAFLGVFLLPLAWPWWAPLAWFVCLLFLSFVLVSGFSRRKAA